MAENKELREQQDERREETGEQLTIESMMRDLAEEADAESTEPERRETLKTLLDVERRTRSG